LDKLSSSQIADWEAYDKLDPIGTWREDFRFAFLMSFLQNIVSALYAKKNTTPKEYTPLDFMPIWDEELRKVIEDSKKQSPEQIKEFFLNMLKKPGQNKTFANRKELKKQLQEKERKKP
jgi:hypothetical protein